MNDTTGADNVDLKYSVLKSVAIEAVKTRKFTIQEAEQFFNVKIPLNEISQSRSDGFYIYNGKNYIPDYYGWSEYCVDKYKFMKTDQGEYIYDFNRKHYRRISQAELEYVLTKDTDNKVKPDHRSNFIKTLHGFSYRSFNDIRPQKPMLNLKNGILDVETRTLKPHTSEIYFDYCLDNIYDEKATCPNWMQFLEDIFPNNKEYLSICSMIFGYVLIGGDPWLHKAFVLYGEGRNGKSTFLEVLQNLIGRSNFSSVSLSNLHKPFSTIHIDAKLANISGETPSDTINAEIFKEATSGGLLTGSFKYQDEYDFKCTARFIFACNKLPKFGENSTGMQERLYFIPFERYFSLNERKSGLTKILSSELPGILNWALSGLDILLDEGRLPEVEATSKIMNEYKSENDSIYAWFNEEIEVGLNNTEYTIQQVYDAYCRYCLVCNNKPYNKINFSKRFRSILKDECNKKTILYEIDPRNKLGQRVLRNFKINSLNQNLSFIKK